MSRSLWTRLRNLSDSIRLCTNLTSLDLDNNSISIYPSGFFSLTSLIQLSMRDNNMIEIPIRMTNLEYILLSGNPIKSPKLLTKCLVSTEYNIQTEQGKSIASITLKELKNSFVLDNTHLHIIREFPGLGSSVLS